MPPGSWPSGTMIESGVVILAAAFASSNNPSRHAMMYTLEGWVSLKELNLSLRTGRIDTMLYLSVTANKSDRVNRSMNFGSSTPG